jgi:UDP-3-O-[3-hydroxymyristoyl] glucosamine N-acyltransferase
MTEYFVHPLAVIDNGAEIGAGSKIWHFSHIRSTAKLGKNVIIGKNVYIDADVIIGSNVKIQNNVSVYHGVTIEDDVFVGPHAVFTNDLRPRATGDWEVSQTIVKKGASIGANSVIICGNNLNSYCMIGAGSIVTKTVPSHALVFGNPAKFQGVVCKCGQKLAGKEAKDNYTYHCEKCGSNISFSKNETV